MGSVNEPRLEDVLLEVLDSRLADVHTALPGKITRYDSAKQVADIELQVNRVDLDPDGGLVKSDYPVLANVPIAFARGGGYFLSLPLVAGDFVFVVFAESAIDQWRAKGSKTYPGDLRKHSLTGAVALPCLYPKGAALLGASSSSMALGADGGAIVEIDAGTVRLGSAVASDPVMTLSMFRAAITALLATGIGVAGTAAFAAAAAAWGGAAPGSPMNSGSSVVKADV